MAASCVKCGVPVDPLRDQARIVDGQVRGLCRTCAGLGERERGSTPSAACWICRKEVPTWKARPVVLGASVLLRCDSCETTPEQTKVTTGELLDLSDEAEVITESVVAPRVPWLRRRPVRYAAPAALAAGVAVALLSMGPSGTNRSEASTSTLAPGLRPPEQRLTPRVESRFTEKKNRARPVVRIHAEILPPDEEPVEHDDAEPVAPPMPGLDYGGTWVHPIPGSERLMPEKLTRRFGADRPGDRPRECGRGHCGVDLEGPRGTPIVAVADGIVEKAVRHTLEDRGGKYVKLVHEGGAYTYYMHLDEIRDDLHRGKRVKAGEWLGTLGRTGIESSPPHLHFALKVPTSRGLRFVDPEPFLSEVAVLDLLDMTVGLDEQLAASEDEDDDGDGSPRKWTRAVLDPPAAVAR